MKTTHDSTRSRRDVLCIAGASAAALACPALVRAEADAWKIGQTAALSGALAWPYVEMNRGIKAAFDEVNEHGGVAGRPLELLSLDDTGVPEKAAANAKQLVEQDRVFTLFACGPTTSVLGAMAVVTQAKVPMIAPSTGVDALHAYHPLVVHTRATYSNELSKILQQSTTIGINNFAVAYFDNAFGKSIVAAFDAAARKYNHDKWKAFLVTDTPQGLKTAIDEIAAFQPVSLISVAIGPNGIPFYVALRNRVKAQAFALSPLGVKPLLQAMGDAGKGVTVAQVVPHPERVALPVVKAYQAAMAKTGVTDWNHASLEGYIQARVLIEGLRRTGKTATHEKFIDAFNTMHSFDLGGYELNYGPNDHLGSNFVELTYFTGSIYRR